MAKIDKNILIDKVKGLEALSSDEKAQLIGYIKSKTYGLVWEDSTEKAWEQLKEYIPVLVEDKEKAIVNDSADQKNPNHILIEGDNLLALTNLCATHEGKIDVIYIDPPYNTGKEDEFKYNDNYIDKEDSFRHSKWLSFIKKRIYIAKKLLSDTGVLFISIDDYSFAQLKLLCDEIFEFSSNPDNWNFLGCLIWDKQHSQQQGTFKKYHEYVLVYAKNRKNIKNVLSKAEGIIEAGAMKKISKKNPASEFSFPAGTKFEAPDGTVFEGTYGDSEKVTVVDGIFEALNGVTKYPVTLYAGWTQKKQMTSWFKGNETIDTKGQKIIEFYFNSTGKIKCRKQRAVTTPPSILPNFGMGSEQTEYLDEIFGVPNKFTNPKPVNMIKLFIDWFCPNEGLVLDFFAGSGTTLDATMKLNAEDGGHRQCILVQGIESKDKKVEDPDTNEVTKIKENQHIAENITYERNKRVINGYTKPNGEEIEGLQGNNLRYFKVGFVPRSKDITDMERFARLSVSLLCIKEDVYKEETMFGDLKAEGFRYFKDGKKQFLVILDSERIGDIVEQFERMDIDGRMPVYVYTTGQYPYTEDFWQVSEKVELYPYPACIYGACEKVMPKMEDKPIVLPEDIQLTAEEENMTFEDFKKE